MLSRAVVYATILVVISSLALTEETPTIAEWTAIRTYSVAEARTIETSIAQSLSVTAEAISGAIETAVTAEAISGAVETAGPDSAAKNAEAISKIEAVSVAEPAISKVASVTQSRTVAVARQATVSGSEEPAAISTSKAVAIAEGREEVPTIERR